MSGDYGHSYDVKPEEQAGDMNLGEIKEQHEEEVDEERRVDEAEEKILQEAAERLKTMGVSKAFEKLETLLGRSSFYSQLILEKLQKEEQKAKRKAAFSPRKTKKPKQRKAKRVLKEVAQPTCDYAVDDSVSACLADCDLTYFTGGTLRDYQAEGVLWMKTHYENGINGLLADEMGLGKTVQVIAFICHLYAKGVKGPFLIVAPLSTIPNWLSEFERFAPLIPVLVYHGPKLECEYIRRKIDAGVKLNGSEVFHVVVTTYDRLIRDVRKLNYPWRYLVVDEGHRIKNVNCVLLKALKQLRGCGRLLLTGTPLQNNIAELWSLLNFLLPEVFFDLDWFLAFFDFKELCQSDGSGKDDDSSMASFVDQKERQILLKLHEILSPFLLRRIKENVELEIPPKREVVVYAPFSPLQMRYYKAALDGTIAELILGGRSRGKTEDIMETEKSGLDLQPRSRRKRRPATPPANATYYSDLKCIRMRWMMLSKICMHPYLLHAPLNPDGTVKVDEDLVRKSGKMMVLDRLLSRLIPRGHKILVYLQIIDMMSIIEDYCSLRSYNYCRLDGSMSLEERRQQIDSFNHDKRIPLFLLSTRAGGLGINLAAADTVIFFQNDWNPQADLQAEDRCHRIGQGKTVLVIRLIVRGSIDEVVFNRASAKRRLEKLVIHSARFKSINPASSSKTEDLLSILDNLDYSKIAQFRGDDLSSFLADSELDQLLDRSDLTGKQ